MSSRAQSRDLPRLLPYNFYAAILDEILRFAALSQDDRVGCYPGPYYSFPGPTISSRAPLCHPERSRGISRVYCLTTSTLQSWIRSFGSLRSLRMTGWGVIPGLTIPSRAPLFPPESHYSLPSPTMSSRAQSRDLPRLLPCNFYAAILDKILRFAALSQDDRVGRYPGPYYSFPGPTIPSRVYCLITSTLQSWMRSFGSLRSLRMTGLSVIPSATMSSRVYCLTTFTPQSWIRSFGSLHSLMTTELECYPQPAQSLSEAM